MLELNGLKFILHSLSLLQVSEILQKIGELKENGKKEVIKEPYEKELDEEKEMRI